MREQGCVAGLALFSLGLALSWAWLKANRVQEHLWQHLPGQWPGQVARFLYFVGLPYLALVSGLLAPRLLGLKGLENFILIDWRRASAAGPPLLAQMQTALVLMLLEWLVDSSQTLTAGIAAFLLLGGLRWGLARSGLVMGAGFQKSVLDTIYDGLHWAFYRALIWLLSGDLYLAVVLGVGLVLFEWAVTARLQGQILLQDQGLLLNLIILILTAAVFFYSPNLWLLWPVHLALVMLVRTPRRSEPSIRRSNF